MYIDKFQSKIALVLFYFSALINQLIRSKVILITSSSILRFGQKCFEILMVFTSTVLPYKAKVCRGQPGIMGCILQVSMSQQLIFCTEDEKEVSIQPDTKKDVAVVISNEIKQLWFYLTYIFIIHTILHIRQRLGY